MLLARIVNLNRLGEVFRRAKDDPASKGLQGLRTHRGTFAPDKIGKWLDAKLTRRRTMPADLFDALKRDFVADVLKILNRDGETAAFEPTWATLWKDLRPHLDDGPARWSEVLGVNHNGLPDQWILLLVYPVAEADIIARPTQLDICWTGCHYPSPRSVELHKGGHTMDLRHEPSATDLLSEYIHVRVNHRIEHYERGGCRLERISGPVTTDLDPRGRIIGTCCEGIIRLRVPRWLPAGKSRRIRDPKWRIVEDTKRIGSMRGLDDECNGHDGASARRSPTGYRGGPEAQFLDWLRGYDLPVAGDEEPYVWLVRGLEAHGDLGARGGAFCERIRAVLVAQSRPE